MVRQLKKIIAGNRKGLTLIELIISIALLSIIVMIAGDIFVFSFNILGKSARKKIDSMNASSGIELTTANTAESSHDVTVNKTSGTFNINFGDTDVQVNGTYVQGISAGGDVSYESFIPNP